MPALFLVTSRTISYGAGNRCSFIALLVAILVSIPCFMHAQSAPPAIQWDRTFGGFHDERLTYMVSTPDGGYLLGGDSDSEAGGDKSDPKTFGGHIFWLIKIDKEGKKQWDKSFGRAEGSNHLSSILAIADGGFLLGGISPTIEIPKNGSDYWIVRIDKDGNKMWERVFRGQGVFGVNRANQLTSMVLTEDGGFLVGGSSNAGMGADKSEESRGEMDYWIIKTDPDGNKQWDKTFGGTGGDTLKTILRSPDGGYLLGGTSSSGIGADKSAAGKGMGDYWVVKIDKDGNKFWDKTFGGTENESLSTMVAGADGGYLLAGSSQSGMSGDKSAANKGLNDFWIVKVDLNGDKQWDKNFGADNFDAISALLGGVRAVVVTADAGYLIAGSSASGIGGDKSEDSRGDFDYWVVRVDDLGNKLWDKTYGGDQFDNLSSAVTTSDGGYLIGGSSLSGISGDKSDANKGVPFSADYWIIKLGSDVVKKEQVITFDSITNHAVGDAPFALVATTSSGLAVDFRVVSGPATLTGHTVTITGTGLVTIEATQAGNSLYNPATPVSRHFTVTPGTSIVITSFAPASGPAGTVVLIEGLHFGQVRSIQFNGVNADFFIVNHHRLIATVPLGATTGFIRINDANGNITSSIAAFRVTYPTPSIVFFAPGEGPTGTLVTIVGANFDGANAVLFNGIASPYFRVLNAFVIQATVPAGAGTGRINVVTVGGRGSSANNFIFTRPRSFRREIEPDGLAANEGNALVYPNPFTNAIIVRNLPDGMDVPVTLYNLEGKIVLKKQGVVSGQQIEVQSSLPAGIYILQVGEGKAARKYKVTKTN